MTTIILRRLEPVENQIYTVKTEPVSDVEDEMYTVKTEPVSDVEDDKVIKYSPVSPSYDPDYIPDMKEFEKYFPRVFTRSHFPFPLYGQVLNFEDEDLDPESENKENIPPPPLFPHNKIERREIVVDEYDALQGINNTMKFRPLTEEDLEENYSEFPEDSDDDEELLPLAYYMGKTDIPDTPASPDNSVSCYDEETVTYPEDMIPKEGKPTPLEVSKVDDVAFSNPIMKQLLDTTDEYDSDRKRKADEDMEDYYRDEYDRPAKVAKVDEPEPLQESPNELSVDYLMTDGNLSAKELIQKLKVVRRQQPQERNLINQLIRQIDPLQDLTKAFISDVVKSLCSVSEMANRGEWDDPSHPICICRNTYNLRRRSSPLHSAQCVIGLYDNFQRKMKDVTSLIPYLMTREKNRGEFIVQAASFARWTDTEQNAESSQDNAEKKKEKEAPMKENDKVLVKEEPMDENKVLVKEEPMDENKVLVKEEKKEEEEEEEEPMKENKEESDKNIELSQVDMVEQWYEEDLELKARIAIEKFKIAAIALAKKSYVLYKEGNIEQELLVHPYNTLNYFRINPRFYEMVACEVFRTC